MDVSRWVVDRQRPDDYVLDPVLVRQRGLFRAWRTSALLAVVLLLVQAQVRVVALTPVAGADASEVVTWFRSALLPGRLSLILDVAMVVAYVMAAVRGRRYVVSVLPGAASLARGAAVLVGGGAVLDLWEDLRLAWLLTGRPRGVDALSVSFGEAIFAEGDGAAFSWTVRVTVGLGLVATLALVVCASWVASRRGRLDVVDADDLAPSSGPGVDRPDPEGTIICCSGGGIRAAAFTMGGLQALRSAGRYDTASHVVGVSGGGYAAAAFHVARWSPGDRGKEDLDWHHPEPGRLFSLDSPECGWVRRHTRYLLGSFSTALQGALSLLYGVAVNLLLLGSVLVVSAWTLGLVFRASGRLDVERVRIVTGDIDTGWQVLELAWTPVAVGVGLFIVRRAIEKWHTPSRELRVGIEWATAWLIRVGAVAVTLALVVPWLLVQLCAPTPLGLGDPWGSLLNATVGVDYPDPDGDAVVTASQARRGTTIPEATSAGLGAIVTAILAVLRGAKSVGSGAGDGWRATAWRAVRDVVVPWLAATAVALVLAGLLLRLTAGVVRDPAAVADPRVVWWAVGLLVFAKLTADANRTSLHHFYRWRIALAFLVRRRGRVVEPIPYRRPLRFSESAPLDGGPALVSCAVANVADEDLVPSDRGCVPFVFDHQQIGLTDRLLPAAGGRQPSEVYEHVADSRFRDVTVPAALAISGAAFSPLAGRENKLLGPFRVVLALANARLGVWLPNPLYVDTAKATERYERREGGDCPGDDTAPFADRRAAAARRLAEAERAVARHRVEVAEAERAVRVAGPRSWARGLARVRRLRPARGLDRAVRERDARRAAAARTDHELAEASSRRQDRRRARRQNGFARVLGDISSTWRKPGLTRVAKEAFGKASIYDQFLYVTDGGHYDNLGLVEALRRRPKEVIVLDASNDKEDEFSALGVAIATARMDLDCEIDIDPRQMRKAQEPRSPVGWCRGTYRYADGSGEGTLLVAKAVMLDDLSWDLEAYVAAHPDFPRTSTVDQLYGELDFEAYRALGQHATEKLLAMPEPADP